jgi:proteic killer suppression protein
MKLAKRSRVRPDRHKRGLRALDALDAATSLRDLSLPGFGVHPLQGRRTGVYALAVSGSWRITFRWDERPRSRS